jgi:MATE family multidrug resistance protein
MAEPASPWLRASPDRIGHRAVLTIALPITVSNATVPLIGFVDTAVIGQLGVPHLMGAMAVAAVIFNLIYWAFSFLRMGTTGLTAQALGAGDKREIAGHLLRALLVALAAALLLVLFQRPLRTLLFWLTGGSPEVVAAGHIYFDIRIWAAPAGLVNFALLGWLIGLGRAGMAFALQLLLNVLNILLALALGLGLGLGIVGVAWAAFVAENVAAGAGLICAIRLLRAIGAFAPLSDAVDVPKLRRSIAVNVDITIRSLVAFASLIAFTAHGAGQGDVTLAANGLLLNIQSVMIYLLDGFAFAAEALVGRSVGARDRVAFWQAVEVSTLWAAAFAVLCSLATWFAGEAILAMSARSSEVFEEARRYLIWSALAPVVGVWAFQLDGIFIGATRTRDMRNMMLLSAAVFAVAYAILPPLLGNHGLWLCMMILFLARAATLLTRLPALVRAAFP